MGCKGKLLCTAAGLEIELRSVDRDVAARLEDRDVARSIFGGDPYGGFARGAVGVGVGRYGELYSFARFAGGWRYGEPRSLFRDDTSRPVAADRGDDEGRVAARTPTVELQRRHVAFEPGIGLLGQFDVCAGALVGECDRTRAGRTGRVAFVAEGETGFVGCFALFGIERKPFGAAGDGSCPVVVGAEFQCAGAAIAGNLWGGVASVIPERGASAFLSASLQPAADRSNRKNPVNLKKGSFIKILG